MGRRIQLVRKGVPWATLVRCVLFRGAGKGLLGVSQCVCAPATSLCGGTMLAPYGWNGQVLCKEGGWSIFWFLHFFVFGKFVILIETNVRGKNIPVNKQKLCFL